MALDQLDWGLCWRLLGAGWRRSLIGGHSNCPERSIAIVKRGDARQRSRMGQSTGSDGVLDGLETGTGDC